MVTGIGSPVRQWCRASTLTIGSNAHEMKSANWNSTTGRRPTSAAPAARPVNPVSAIGVSTTRRPELLEESLRHLEGAAELTDVLPDDEDVGVAVHLAVQGQSHGLQIGGLPAVSRHTRLPRCCSGPASGPRAPSAGPRSPAAGRPP